MGWHKTGVFAPNSERLLQCRRSIQPLDKENKESFGKEACSILLGPQDYREEMTEEHDNNLQSL